MPPKRPDAKFDDEPTEECERSIRTEPDGPDADDVGLSCRADLDFPPRFQNRSIVMLEALPPDLRDRTRRLNRRRLSSRQRESAAYVMVWLRQALRGFDNPILDAAIAIADDIGKPVLVYHGLDNRYPYANHRLHRFALQASRTLQTDVLDRGLSFVRFVRRPDHRGPNRIRMLAEHAAVVLTDDLAIFDTVRWARSVAAQIDRPMFAVDAACLVTESHFDRHHATTRGFRSAHTPLRTAAMNETADVPVPKSIRKPLVDPPPSDELPKTDAALDRMIGRCGVDMTVPPASDFAGDRRTALNRLNHAIVDVLPRYKWTRNNPSLDESSSRLSPYFHFGVLGPREATIAIHAADLHSAARWKFLDEMLTWREYYHHRGRHVADWSRYESLPAYARQTLDDHRDDSRPHLYSIGQLIRGETDDTVWNAAQRQFTLDGWMHNNLRMVWVKQILRWTPSPESAFATACYLNDRFSLDGRDASTYGGIRWGFGESRPGYREIDVYGKVPPKSSSALMKRSGVNAWVEQMNQRPVGKIATDQFARSRRYSACDLTPDLRSMVKASGEVSIAPQKK